MLMHGFPYDPRAYDDMAPILAAAGYRAIVPYLRGYGPTRFLSDATPRSGQQAALGHDLRDLMDALGIASAGLVGYDWGGRAACVVAALWPERARYLVTGGGYNIQDIPGSVRPAPPERERGLWYQYYFHTERGRAGLTAYRRELTRMQWQLASATWKFDDATFERSAVSFDNPDFVDVVIQSYRHRFNYAPGDPAYEASEALLAERRPISVPTIALQGGGGGLIPAGHPKDQARLFSGPYETRIIPGAGHNLPQEAPAAVADAVFAAVAAAQSAGQR
jgi:pimeloyl-ACP methyl ester carboxylesterase